LQLGDFKMSRIIHFTKIGGPEVLSFKDIKVSSPGPGELRIKVKAIGLNRTECLWRSGISAIEELKLPARLGYEAAGIVDAVGPDVTNFAIGDHVSTIPAFSQSQYGIYGELVLAPAYATVKYPSNLSFMQAASIWMMFATAYGALVEEAKLTAGDVVLIPAASSSVGLAAIQIANMLGATPIAITRSSKKRKQLEEAGAAHVIASEEQDLVTEVMKITGGIGARVVLEAVGGPNFPKLINSMTTRGTLIIYGLLSDEMTPLSMLDIISKMPIITGYQLKSTLTNPGRFISAVNFILGGLATSSLKPVIDSKLFTFDQMVDAHRYMETNQQFGKIVVSV
jgi:NADPH:quinone reductase-like Zn-dependent oxidoreductase